MTSQPDSTHPETTRPVRAAVSAAMSAAGVAGALAMLIGGVAGFAEQPGILPRAAAAPSDQLEADESGYLNSAARCDADQTLVAYGRTTRAQVAICLDPGGDLQYRGVRSSDGAFLMMPAGRAADGSIVATNGDATYAVSPSTLLVSEGDAVLYRGSWIEFREPGFDTGPASSSASSSPTSSSASSSPAASTAQTSAEPTTDSNSEVPTTTVSTTTVTVTAEPS